MRGGGKSVGGTSDSDPKNTSPRENPFGAGPLGAPSMISAMLFPMRSIYKGENEMKRDGTFNYTQDKSGNSKKSSRRVRKSRGQWQVFQYSGKIILSFSTPCNCRICLRRATLACLPSKDCLDPPL